MRKIVSSILTLVLLSLLLTGCGSSDGGSSTAGLTFKKNGEIVHTIVEEFAESYYSLDELTASVEEQISSFNSTNGADSIRLDSAEVQDGIITMVMTFSKSSSYSGFYRKALFCGTVQEAFNAGYDLNITLSSVDDSSVKIGRTDILEMSDRHIIIAREAISIRPYAEILYTSGDVSVSENKKEATPGNGENLSYIIFK